ncbi:nuclear transport factor 2 family protein [Dokdonella koreensis]|uniref:DUF4440 domain-containing protein n=1 Tax=Dokdonella koreensis DS-123 TaxID=1300342 RepID=A0A167H795_9GAMM|nr:nuclear transport factor 2 family protein [Dokdonella koreensis]ANB19282.1 Hypothetical protein I596_3293 [Dokdonella koreensis DS-123]
MRIVLPWLLAVHSCTLTTPGRSAPAPACPEVATTGADVEAVRARELRGARANLDGWTLADARGFFAPEYFSIQMDGSIRRLNAVFAGFTDGRSPGWARRFELADLQIHVYRCDTAVVTGLIEASASAAPANAPPWRIRYLNLWRRQGDQWLNAANQFVRVTSAPAPAP